ncbi:MAG: 16S rRNA (cytidine(1402)-2'-O)-methyltransferase [Rickettsiales bacterium]|jgi:16S rRNA (cytidine1402-2'-O)-methyltransferase|nr:16S rRNA (cytidine(1402)-2'-O)-methyltransferase [Rickettsiales bacterium]
MGLAGLCIVGTPIGNFGDFSPRGADALRRADIVVCEDSRVAGKLCAHFGIKAKFEVFAEYNEAEKLPLILDMIRSGASIALTTDSGMPGVSDPGFRLARACRDEGLPVSVVPGPTAAVSALALSGFPSDRFSFLGFFRGESALREDNHIRHTIIYYESANRLMETLTMCAKVMPERKIAIVREITKVHEETIIGYPADLLKMDAMRGEITLVIAPAPDKRASDEEIAAIVGEATGLKTKDAAAILAMKTGMSKTSAYEKILAAKK